MNNIIEYLRREGVRTVEEDFITHIQLWQSWYRGAVEDFHSYKVYNGVGWIGQERAQLNMAKTVCEDWANLLLNERVQIAVENDQDVLDDLLRVNLFPREGNRTVEKAFALGTGAFTEYLDANGAPRIDYHDAESIWPMAWSGSKVTECAFSSVEVLNGKKATYLRMYRLNPDGTYRIENVWLNYDTGERMAAPEGVQERVETKLRTPLFQLVTPNIAVNVDTICPMGISVYANALSALKGIDAVYDSFVNEFLLGRKRLMIPATMAKIEMSKTGEMQPLFDPKDTTFIAYTPAEDQSDGFHDLSPEIRAEQHLTGIRTCLNMLSFKCGLGTGRYDFDRASGVKTATEVVSEQSDLYQSMVKHEQVLRDALIGLAQALLALSGKGEDREVIITFDDSVIQDKSAIMTEAREEVGAGLMSKFRFLTEIKGMPEDAAQEELNRIGAEQKISAEAIDFFGTQNASD